MNSQRKRRYLSTILLAVFGLMLFAPGTTQAVHAQNQGDVTLTAHAGFDGNCKQNAWIPIRVKVENKGADLNARIQVAYENTIGGKSAHAVDISLPTNSRKEMFLYLYPDKYLSKVSVDVVVGDQVIVTTPLNINCIGSESLMIGSLSSDTLSTISINHDVQFAGFVRVAQLQLTDLPDQPQGWESLDALVIANVDMGSITDKQRIALKGWLAQGGKLLMTGGPQWQGTINGLDEILPVALNGTKTLNDLSALQAYAKTSIVLDAASSPAIVATGKLQPKSVVLLEQDGVPLLVQKQFGAGSIYYLAADPSLQPLKSWGGMPIFYGHLLGTHSFHPGWSNPEWDSSAANQALAALPALGLPPTLYVLCLLGIYILVIGPINYLILRRMKRQELAWITIPAFVLLFTLVAYFSGFWIRGARPILNRLAIVNAWDGIDQAQVRGLVGVYAPIRTKYTLQAGGLFLPYPFDSNNQTLQTNQGWLSVLHGTEILLPDILVESGGMKSTFLSGSVPAIKITHNLVLALSESNPTITGSITNNSKYTLKNAVLITVDDAKKLGDLAPGATKRVQAVLSFSPVGSDIYDFQSQNLYSYSQNDQPDDRVIRQNALMRALQTSGQIKNKVTSGIYLIGWVDDALLATSVQGQSFDSYDTTFYTLALSPTLSSKPGPIKLTPGLFSWESSTPDLSPYMSDYYGRDIPPGGYSLTFKLAVPIHYSSVKSLKLGLNANNITTNKPTGIKVSLRDWQTGQWVAIADVTWGSMEIPDPARFVGPEGEISLRIDPITNANRNFGQITTSYFTLVVEP